MKEWDRDAVEMRNGTDSWINMKDGVEIRSVTARAAAANRASGDEYRKSDGKERQGSLRTVEKKSQACCNIACQGSSLGRKKLVTVKERPNKRERPPARGVPPPYPALAHTDTVKQTRKGQRGLDAQSDIRQGDQESSINY